MEFFSLVGSAFAFLENTPAVPGYENISREETFKAVIRQSKRLGVRDKLRAFDVATQYLWDSKTRGKYYLIILDFEKRRVKIRNYTERNLDKANRDYGEIEKEISSGRRLQAVLVSAGSISNLKQAYPNYFLDTQEFAKQLERIEKAIKDD